MKLARDEGLISISSIKKCARRPGRVCNCYWFYAGGATLKTMLMGSSTKPIDRWMGGIDTPVHQFTMTGYQVTENELPSVWVLEDMVRGPAVQIPLESGDNEKRAWLDQHVWWLPKKIPQSFQAIRHMQKAVQRPLIAGVGLLLNRRECELARTVAIRGPMSSPWTDLTVSASFRFTSAPLVLAFLCFW